MKRRMMIIGAVVGLILGILLTRLLLSGQSTTQWGNSADSIFSLPTYAVAGVASLVIGALVGNIIANLQARDPKN